MTRSGTVGPSGSLTTGLAFGTPPIIKFGSYQLQERFLPDLLLGRKRICLAITEPGVGSDVASIATTATKSADGKYYAVNGTKKWYCQSLLSTMHFLTAVQDNKRGLEPLCYNGRPHLRARCIWSLAASCTSFEPTWCYYAATKGSWTNLCRHKLHRVDDVQVPAENLIGAEGLGMKYIMTNFNHERLSMCISATRMARVALSAAFEYVMKREAFGKTLVGQPVVRHRLAKAGALLESQSAWVEQFVYQMSRMSKAEADVELGGLTALCKAQSGMVLDECARCAVLLFGGNGFTRTGQEEIAERRLMEPPACCIVITMLTMLIGIYREVPGIRIPGGSEDVLMDLAVRQLVKNYENRTRLLEQPKGSSRL